jgi:RNA polymerase sigma-70 factor (ECF subfamily)
MSGGTLSNPSSWAAIADPERKHDGRASKAARIRGDDPGTPADEALRPLDRAVAAALVASQRDFLRYFARRLGSADEAEDALQEFRLRALERAGQLRDTQKIDAWLGRILRSTLVDLYRRRAARRRAEAALRELLPADPAGADDELESVVCTCLYRLLPTLKAEYADVLWRADLLGQPRELVARELRLTANNVTVRLHRARRALRHRLEQSCKSCPVHGFFDCDCPVAPTSEAAPATDPAAPRKAEPAHAS